MIEYKYARERIVRGMRTEMKRELDHFYIGRSYGGNQDWFRTFMMRLGGCAAETACDSSLYFALRCGVQGIYPYDADHLTRSEYVDFAHRMKEYLWPRWTGVNKLSIFIEGYAKYLADSHVTGISMNAFDGEEPYVRAADTVIRQIDAGCPIPTLILNHKDKELKFYEWHWFLINGYDEQPDTVLVKAVTYSGYRWLDLRELWDTGHTPKGGFVLFHRE